MANEPKNSALGVVILIAVLGMASWRLLAPLPLAQGAPCDLNTQSCSTFLADQELRIEVVPQRPAANEQLRLVLSLEKPTGLFAEEPAPAIQVEFNMPGMDMGEHTTALQHIDRGSWEGHIALPYCPMGQSLWQVTIRIQLPDGDQALPVGVLHVAE